MNVGIVISTLGNDNSIDIKYTTLGRQTFPRLGAAIVGLDIQHAYHADRAELQEWDDGYWSVVVHRQGGLPVAVNLGNMPISEWLAREPLPVLVG